MYQGSVKLLELAVKACWLFTCLIGFLMLPVMLVILTEGYISINLILKTSLIFWPEQVLPGVCYTGEGFLLHRRVNWNFTNKCLWS